MTKILTIVIAGLIVVGGGYFFYQNQFKNDPSIQNADKSIDYFATTTSRSNTTNLPSTVVQKNASGDCSKYITAQEISKILGYNNPAVFRTQINGDGDCSLWWADDPSHLDEYSQYGHFHIIPDPDASITKYTCDRVISEKKGYSANIGDESCIFGFSVYKDNVLDFFKNGTSVSIAFDSALPPENTRAKLLMELARVIESKIDRD